MEVLTALRTWSLIALVLLPATARATAAGTILSGPTTDDPLAVYWNPAAMTLLDGTSGVLHGGFSAIRVRYWRTTPNLLDDSTYPRADLDVIKPDIALGLVSDGRLRRWRFGLAFTIPVLDGATWSETYGGKPSSSRYFALRGRLVHFNLRPAAAVQLGRYVALGVGLDVLAVLLSHDAMTDFGAKANQLACGANQAACQVDAPLAREDPTYDARTRVSGVGWGAGIAAGVLVTPVPWLRLGASFSTGAGSVSVPVDMEVELPAAATDFMRSSFPSVQLPALRARGSVETYSPITVAAGAQVSPIERLELAADLQWVQRSKMSVMYGSVQQTSSALIGDQVLIKALSDDLQVGFRASYLLWPRLLLALRVEYDPDSRPEPFVTPISVDFDKVHLQVGFAWRATRAITIVADYGHYFLFDRRIERSFFAPNATATTPEEQGLDKPHPLGVYSGAADRIGVALQVTL